ncbi:MAG: ATP-binding cassette domain-containing protein [Desulfobacteraceae bacterium]|nr:ATP-binding cassette domain-containing protein [Desulfobacteraceae bacterium]
MEKDIILNVKEMSVAFDTEAGMIHAVDQLSFDLEKGIALGVVGESGCGKSVTALSIMRLLPKPVGQIINGSIIYNDQDILKFSSEELSHIRGKKIVIIFQ